MPSRPEDAGLFIRSLTAAGGSEAIGAHVDLMAEALAAFGFEIVIVETAGAGQSDTAVRALADVVVLLVQPESGDELQWQKAGLLEIADVVVVHKADLPGSDRLQAQVQQLLNLPGCRPVPVLQVSAGKSTGLDELWAAIEAVPGRANSRPDDDRTSLLRLAQEQIRQRFERDPGRLEPLVARWRRGEMDDERAADELLRILSGKE
jgi:putative protein kinase ArgK-like GTPase of G3E family